MSEMSSTIYEGLLQKLATALEVLDESIVSSPPSTETKRKLVQAVSGLYFAHLTSYHHLNYRRMLSRRMSHVPKIWHMIFQVQNSPVWNRRTSL